MTCTMTQIKTICDTTEQHAIIKSIIIIRDLALAIMNPYTLTKQSLLLLYVGVILESIIQTQIFELDCDLHNSGK